MNGCMSGELSSSTGSSQGCVLSPFLYILYTDDCRSQYGNRSILKFAADEISHGPVVDKFVHWCECIPTTKCDKN